MRKIITRLLLPALLAFTSATLAQDRSALAQDLLKKSGTWAQLASFEPQVRAGLAEAMAARRPVPSAAEAERSAAAVGSHFAPGRLRAVATRVVAQGLADEHQAALQRWYDSPAGQAITVLEEKASQEQTDMAEVARRGTAEMAGSPPRRRELLNELLRETRAAEVAVQMTFNVMLAAHRGVVAALPGGPAPSESELKASLEAQRVPLLQAYGQLMAASYALTYSSLPDAELERYLGFVKSPAGQHFFALSIRALDTAISEAIEDLSRSLPGTKDQANS